MVKKIPKECKNCIHFWAGGIKDGKHDRWCCAYQGGPAPKMIGHCKNTGYSQRVEKTS